MKSMKNFVVSLMAIALIGSSLNIPVKAFDGQPRRQTGKH